MTSITAAVVRLTASFCLAGASVAFADPALASASAELPQVRVATADLNLRSPAGRATAARRIRAAAATVCAIEGTNGATDPRCMATAIEQGRQAIDRQVNGLVTLAAN